MSQRNGIALVLCVLCWLNGCSAPQFHPVSDQKVAPSIVGNAFVMSDGYLLPFNTYVPETPKAVVVALHGFNDYRKAFDDFCSAMKAREIACFAFDQRGFGETAYHGYWSQPGQLQSDFLTVVGLLAKRFPELPVFAAGESMGGAVILTALRGKANSDAISLKGAILMAPAVWARHTQPWYQRLALWLTVHTFPGWRPTGEGLEIQATDNIEALREMGRDPLVIKGTRIDAIYGLTNLMDQALASVEEQHFPLLVLYGERDEVIPQKPTCEMLRRMVTAEVSFDFALYENGYHMLTRDLQAQHMFADVVDWIRGQRVGDHAAEKVKDYCE